MPFEAARLEDVVVTDPYLRNAEDKTISYLLALDPERLLYSFYRTAGLQPTTAEGYGGWEREEGMRFQGHFFGHVISALSQAYASTGDERLLVNLAAAVRGLGRCQQSYALRHPDAAGYVSAFSPDLLPAGGDGLLVPFYNLHKIVAGLLDAHRYAPDEIAREALAVVSGFATWVERYAASLADPADILDTEYGGMNEALYRLYEITGDPVHRRAAERFDETDLFRQLAEGRDVLAGLHANTTIPKLTGALTRHTVLNARGELDDATMYRRAAENFWQIVVDDHTYANGANSQSEHFHAPGTLHERAHTGGTTGYGENSTAEGCNEYNMLKLSRALFALTGEKKYVDYDESTFVNSILASQNPETGMVTYFQPQTAGYAKVFGERFDQFWCDHGTGIESFTKLADGIYAFEDDAVIVNQFRSSELRVVDRNLRLTQTADIPRDDTVRLRVEALDTTAEASAVPLRLRVPEWVAGAPVLTVDGIRQSVAPVGGYIAFDAAAGDQITYRLPAEVRISSGTENANWVAFLFGPVLLATELSRQSVEASYTAGVLVEMGVADPTLTDLIAVDDVTAWKAGIAKNLVRIEDGASANGIHTMRFALRNVDDDAQALRWEPYYSLYGARYATYVTLVGPDDGAAAHEPADDTLIDALTSFDNNNSEADKNHAFHRSTVGVRAGAQFREATADADAFFQYDMIVDPAAGQNTLIVRYSGTDAGREFDIVINGQHVRRERLDDPAGDGALHDRAVTIPRSILDSLAATDSYKRDQAGGFAVDAAGRRIPIVTVRFQSAGRSEVGGVFGIRTVRGSGHPVAP